MRINLSVTYNTVRDQIKDSGKVNRGDMVSQPSLYRLYSPPQSTVFSCQYSAVLIRMTNEAGFAEVTKLSMERNARPDACLKLVPRLDASSLPLCDKHDRSNTEGGL